MAESIDLTTPSTVPRLHAWAVAISIPLMLMLVICFVGFAILSLTPMTPTVYTNRYALFLLIGGNGILILFGPSFLFSILSHDPIRHYKGVVGKLVLPCFILWVVLVRWIYIDMKHDLTTHDLKRHPYSQAVSHMMSENFAAFEWILHTATALSIVCFVIIGGYYLVLRSRKQL